MTKPFSHGRMALLGAAAGALGMAGLLAMPLVDPPGAAPITAVNANGETVETFRIAAADILAITHDSGSAEPLYPADIKPLSGIMAGSAVLTAKLRNAAGEVIGVASRYTAISADPASPDTLWTLVLTRRGTLASHCAARIPGHCGDIVGGSGEFARLQGQLQETALSGGYDLVLIKAGNRP